MNNKSKLDNVAIFVDYDNVYWTLENNYKHNPDSDDSEKNLFVQLWERYKQDNVRTFRAYADFQKIRTSLTSLQKNKEHMNASKEMITCPICQGTVLNHHKKLKFGDTDIREIIHLPVDQVIKTVGKLPQLEKLKEIVGGNIALTEDVSILSRETQVALKMLEIKLASFVGYEIVLQNALPFWDNIKGNIEAISSNNLITICDFPNIYETRETIIDKYFTNGKYKKLTYVYEAFGYKKIVTQINKIKASNPCPFCKGKKVISEDGLHDGVYKLSVPCVSCYASGINDVGLKEIVVGIDIQTWLTGKVSDVVAESVSLEAVAHIPFFNRIRELNKRDMMAVYQCLEQNN